MFTRECVDRVLPVVADSWPELRRCDVYRLLASFAYESPESLRAVADAILVKRPDLELRVKVEVSNLRADLWPGG